MWKYVSRRIRDSVERTYNVLETRRTWTCGGANEKPSPSHPPLQPVDEIDGGGDQQLQQQQQQPPDVAQLYSRCHAVYPYIFNRNQWNGSSSNNGSGGSGDGGGSNGKDDFKQQGANYGPECNFEQNFLGALTWSSAIVCGWYSSQIVCMNKRRNAWRTRRCRDAAAWQKRYGGAGTDDHSSRFAYRKFDKRCLSPWILNPSSVSLQEKSDRTQLWYEHAFETLTNEAEARNRQPPPSSVHAKFYNINNNNNNKANVVSAVDHFRDTITDSSNNEVNNYNLIFFVYFNQKFVCR